MKTFAVIIVIVIVYQVIEFYFGIRDEIPRRRKEDEKYSYKKLNEKINKK